MSLLRDIYYDEKLSTRDKIIQLRALRADAQSRIKATEEGMAMNSTDDDSEQARVINNLLIRLMRRANINEK